MELTITEQTASTNADLLQTLKAGPLPHLHTLLAREQTAGQGRAGRSWDTTYVHALTFSTVLTPPWPHEMWGWIPLLAGAAAAHELQAYAPGVAIKWPNDLVIPAADSTPIHGWGTWRKLGGILTQVAESGEQIVVGIGLNLAPLNTGDGAPNLPAPHAAYLFPPGQPWPGGSATDQTEGGHLDELAIELTRRIVHRLDKFLARDEPSRDEVENLCATLGQRVSVEQIGRVEKIEGKATQLAQDGALGVETNEGLVWISSGDVSHLRA